MESVEYQIPRITFGKIEKGNEGEYLTSVKDVNEASFRSYIKEMEDMGFKVCETLVYGGGASFMTLRKDSVAVYIYYYPYMSFLQIKQSRLIKNLNESVKIPEITFGNIEFAEKENNEATSISVQQVSEEQYDEYAEKLAEDGFVPFESRVYGGCRFMAFKKENDAVFISYYPTISEMRIITEINSAYIDFEDVTREKIVPSLVTQINLTDYGLSEVVRLSDGRFIIFDGGWNWMQDVDKLYNCLKEQSDDEKPVIAAWFMTHPHCDHFWCFVPFYEKYKNSVEIEKILYNFPEESEEFITNFPNAFSSGGFWGSGVDVMPKFFEYAKSSGAKILRPHTGQSFQIGNAFCEILSSPDDVLRLPVDEGNALSLITKMTIEGQVITWFGDGYFVSSKLVERYGDYLRSDIMQLQHHGFTGGTIEGYDAIRPKVVLGPVFDDDCFSRTNIHRPEIRHLCCDLGVEEFFTGKRFNQENITLNLPYTSDPNGKERLANSVKDGLGSLGARTWYFNDLVTDKDGKCMFTILDAASNANVYVTLYFEDRNYNIERMKFDVGGMKRINIADPQGAEDNPVQLHRDRYEIKNVPQGVPFCAKFECSIPIVVSHKEKSADYKY